MLYYIHRNNNNVDILSHLIPNINILLQVSIYRYGLTFLTREMLQKFVVLVMNFWNGYTLSLIIVIYILLDYFPTLYKFDHFWTLSELIASVVDLTEEE